MNFGDWYTDLMSIYRLVDTPVGPVTRSVRTLIAENIPCRVYRSSDPTPSMQRQAAEITKTDMIACDNATDVRAGDELEIVRGALLGYTTDRVKGFAGEPHPFYEPYGAVAPQLMHMEVPILHMQRL